MIWLSFCKNQTNKQTKQTKEIVICPKVLFADVNPHRFSSKRETSLQSTPFQIMDFFHP